MRTIFFVGMYITIIVDVWLLIFTATRPDRRRSSTFTLFTVSLLIYSLGYTALFSAGTSSEAFVALIVENFGIANIPFLYLLTSLALFAPSRYKKSYVYLAMAYSLLMFTVVLTNGQHRLYYTAINMVPEGSGHYLRLGKGVLYFVHQGVSLICLALAYLAMFTRFFRGSRKRRRQMVFFIIGSLISFVVNVLNVTSSFPPGIDPLPMALTLSLVLFSVNFVRDDLMDVVVRARNSAMETMDRAFIVLNNSLDFLYCNESAVRLFPQLGGFTGSEPIRILERWPEELYNLELSGPVSFSLPTSAQTRHYRADIERIRHSRRANAGYSILITDVSEEVRLIEQLEILAATDPLTGILNRRRLLEMIERELEVAKRYETTTALIMFDLDNFKNVNDLYGHETGDEVLKAAVSCVQSSLRIYDIFGRIGGEEFIIFTRSPGLEGLVAFAERLRQKIELCSLASGGKEISFTASFGVFEIPPGGDLKNALARVDEAMYGAKTLGRNQVSVLTESPSEHSPATG
jgi:diguanylate cyclase (GGDEF)-like protein